MDHFVFYIWLCEIEWNLVKVLRYSRNNGKMVMLAPNLSNLLLSIFEDRAESIDVEMLRWKSDITSSHCDWNTEDRRQTGENLII
jgi:hypothetical protein